MILYTTATCENTEAIRELCDLVFCPAEIKIIPSQMEIAVDLRTARIVGVGGYLNPEESVYGDYTLYCVAVHPDYRRKGIATTLVKLLLSKCKFPVYVSAWRTAPWEGTAHMHRILVSYGFECVTSGIHHWVGRHVCKQFGCPYKTPDCECWEDTYVRYR